MKTSKKSNRNSLAISLITAISLYVGINSAHAFGNACKNVNFSVDNEFDGAVTVTNIELWSESEGRWLKDDFKNVDVPKGAKDFVVRKGENVEHAENDKITQIKVHYQYKVLGPSGEIPPRWDTVKGSSTDKNIADPICVANRWYKATINAKPD